MGHFVFGRCHTLEEPLKVSNIFGCVLGCDKIARPLWIDLIGLNNPSDPSYFLCITLLIFVVC